MTISHVGNVHLPREILLPSRVRRDRHKYHLRSNPYDMALKKSVKDTREDWGNSDGEMSSFFLLNARVAITVDTYNIQNKWEKRILLLFCFTLLYIFRQLLTMEILFLPLILFRVSKCH